MDKAPETQSDPVIMREQDEQVIRACCLYQFMTIIDMASLLNMPGSLNHVRKVAARLAGKKDEAPGHYLFRFPLARRSGGNGLRVFVPGEASRGLLHEEDTNGCIWNKPSTMQRYSYSFVYHNLAVTRLCLCASLLCRERKEYYLAETLLSYSIARNPPRVSLTTDGQESSIPVIPDCWLYIERVADGEGTALWFEVDNATTYRQSFHRRLSARLALITSEAYAEYFGTPAVLLCFAVLGNEARMHTLAHWTWELLARQERVQLAPFFRFTSVEYETLYPEALTLFTKPVWRLPADRNQEDSPHVALLPPPQDQEEPHGNSQTTDLS